MSEPELPAWALKRPPARKVVPRPRWVVVLALAMMVFGGHLLTSGFTILRGLGPQPAAAGASGDSPTLDDVRAVRAAFAQAHPTAVRINAYSKLALALLLLYAVAAVFSSDRRARTAAVVAAWVGIGYHLGDALFLFLVVRKGVVAAAPMLATWAANQTPGKPVPSVAQLVSLTDLLIVVTGVVGVGFSVLLLAYFGGTRGRLFFGPGRQPNHGG
jgi:hypothetical protein